MFILILMLLPVKEKIIMPNTLFETVRLIPDMSYYLKRNIFSPFYNSKDILMEHIYSWYLLSNTVTR